MADVEPILSLDQFISETIQQVIRGVVDARRSLAKETDHDGMVIAPDFKNLGMVGNYQKPIYVAFDIEVAVEAGSETGGKGGIKLGVVEAGGGGSAQERKAGTNRLRFTIPVVPPKDLKQDHRAMIMDAPDRSR